MKKCHRNDPNLKECLRNVIESFRGNLSNGIPELMVPPCEPLQIPEIHIKQNAGAIWVESQYNNVIIHGLSNFTLRDIHVDLELKELRVDMWFPVLKMTSNYIIQGKILLMPIMGNGIASANYSKYQRHFADKMKFILFFVNKLFKHDFNYICFVVVICHSRC